MTVDELIKHLKSQASTENVAGMERFGIKPKKVFGISSAKLKTIAKEIGKNHELALELWATEYYEARFLACLIDDPKEVAAEQMDRWAADFDNWAICDSCCGHLFRKTKFAYEKAFAWSELGNEEYVKRAGFALIAWLTVHDKGQRDGIFIEFLDVIEQQSNDERAFVKKAVCWALRQIGKRNAALNRAAIETAYRIKKQNLKAVRWIASDALRELLSEKVQNRLK